MSAPRIDALVAVGDNLLLDTNAVGPQSGAAALLHRNRDAVWPEFKGRDMVTRDPGVRLLVLGLDGATARSTLTQQMKRVPVVDDPVLVAVAVGSRDLMARMGLPSVNHAAQDGEALYEVLTGIFDDLGRRLSDAIMCVANIPDPDLETPAPDVLTEYNTAIAEVAREQGASLVDLYTHFQGHGASAEGDEAWLTSGFEPTPHGASEIRRLFWQALLDV